DDDWREIFAVNLDGAFHFTRAVAPTMKRAGRGAIVNISSGAGRSYSLTGIQAYASAKAGLIGFTRQTARELGRHGIRVNSVAPGFMRTNPATELQWEAMGAAGQARLMDSIALGRLGVPEDVARAVLFFVSDDAAYVTGQTISVDGGQWMLGRPARARDGGAARASHSPAWPTTTTASPSPTRSGPSRRCAAGSRS